MAKTGGGTEGGQAYRVREVRSRDLGSGFLESLGALADVGGLSAPEAARILKEMHGSRLYHVFVAVAAGGEVIGATTLLVERKFIHKGGLVGHIEDVAVREGHQGMGVGRSLVKKAVETAQELGCYKCILDCKEDLVRFYEGLGFSRRDVGMRVDLKPAAYPSRQREGPAARGRSRSSGTGT